MSDVEPSICELDPSLFDLEAVTFSVSQVFRTLRKKSGLKGPHFNPNDKENMKQYNSGQRCRGTVEKAAVLSSSSWVQDSPMPAPVKPHRPNRLSRSQRLKNGELGDTTDTKPGHQSPKTSSFHQREPFSEDVLWTDKYHPEHSREVIGNRAAVEKLHSWLKRWKLQTDSEERLKYEDALNKERTNDCWDCGDFVDEVVAGDRTEEHLCNTVLLTGPTGVGKTAAVYACAMELGFKVFEVNCSSRRCGQEVLAQLKEATQSHLVETDTDPFKPAFFNSSNTDRCSSKSHTVPAKSLKKAAGATSKNRRAQKRSIFKNKANPIPLTSYFKTKAKAEKLYHRAMSTEESKRSTDPAVNVNQKGTFSKKMVTCLILFEEVDVIFEDDVGFLAAIKTLMTITKRPVILTTTDLKFRDRFNSSLDEIYFQTPSMADVCSYLQLVCLAENVQLDSDDVNTLFKLTRGDVRRCLLQLQLWGNSGGGRSTAFEREFNYKGCSANMLGLQSVTQMELQHLLHEEQTTKLLLQPLVESWRNGFPIMYSNLELLLFEANKCSCHGSGENTPFCKTQQMEKTCMYLTCSDAKTKSRLSRKKSRSFSKIVTSPKAQRPANEMDSTNSLRALSDFFDLMSFIDASMPQTQQAVAQCQLEDFVWTGAKIQDGQLDEKEEEDKSQEIILDIQATLEVLGFRRCKKSSGNVSWRREPFPTLNSKNLSLITANLCPHSVYQRRFEVSKKVLSTMYFRLLHNTRAVCTDYLPVIRLFCRTHRKRQKRKTEEQDWCLNSFKTRLGLSKKTVEILANEFC